MPKVRVATFNCENLFARYRFRDSADPEGAVRDGWLPDQTRFDLYNNDSKRITGHAIEATNADVVALQEIEGVDSLKRFRSRHIDGGRRAYPHLALIDGNDPRLIDVAVMSKYPITRIRTYQHRRKSPRSRSYIFSRDCLEVDVEVDGQTLTLFVQHYKSMIGGRARTRPRRQDQVAETRAIIERRFGAANTGDHPWIVLGDFNDYMEPGTSLGNLVNWDQVEDVIHRLPQAERWTHYWAGGDEYHQLDYLLLSRSLARTSTAMPEIIRKGLPKRATRYSGSHFRGVGDNTPKASDHCPVVVEVEL
jgi:endonuclease/exonuclease/phosphatase family metal-dependent hydrolase